MSNSGKSTKGTSEKKIRCVKETRVTNQFKKMMSEALDATKNILSQRRKDLSEQGWDSESQEEFQKIFGLTGNQVITIDSKAEKEKVRESDKDTEFDPYIEKREGVTAYQFMKESIERLINIVDKLSVEDPDEKNILLHGNFVNYTDKSIASANVRADQTYLLNPIFYKSTLRVNIYQNFVCKPLTGKNSKVSTLCHEFSHFYRDGAQGEYGGMGTDDMPTKGGYSNTKPYVKNANEFRDEHNQYVFKNAYNIERYFELPLSTGDNEN